MAATKVVGLLSWAFLLLVPALAMAQQGATVTGRATGDAGAPLAAVTITIPELGVGR